jgi:hypothetical protein
MIIVGDRRRKCLAVLAKGEPRAEQLEVRHRQKPNSAWKQPLRTESRSKQSGKMLLTYITKVLFP